MIKNLIIKVIINFHIWPWVAVLVEPLTIRYVYKIVIIHEVIIFKWNNVRPRHRSGQCLLAIRNSHFCTCLLSGLHLCYLAIKRFENDLERLMTLANMDFLTHAWNAIPVYNSSYQHQLLVSVLLLLCASLCLFFGWTIFRESYNV